MEIRKLFLGRDEFKTAREIIELVGGYHQFDRESEDTNSAQALLIFQISTQQTWLVATRLRLYCVLDDVGKSFTRVQWAIPASELITNNEVTVNITTRDKTDRTGLLNIGERRKNWLFSKKLFASESIEDSIK